MPGCILRIALGLALALGASGCVFGGQGNRPVDAEQLDELIDTPGPPLYFAGRSFAGLPLTHAEREVEDRALFVYGTCEVEDPDGFFGPEGGSCSPPIQIQIFPIHPEDWRPGVALPARCAPSTEASQRRRTCLRRHSTSRRFSQRAREEYATPPLNRAPSRLA